MLFVEALKDGFEDRGANEDGAELLFDLEDEAELEVGGGHAGVGYEEGFRVGEDAGVGLGGFHANAFDEGDVGAVADEDGDAGADAEDGEIVVEQVAIGDGFVGDDDGGVGGGLDAGGAPADVGDGAFLLGGEADELADGDGSFDQEVDAGEEVAESVLQGESHGEATDAEGGEDGGNGDAPEAEEDEQADAENEEASEGAREAGHREGELGDAALDHRVEHDRHAENDEADDGVLSEVAPAGFEIEDIEAEFNRAGEDPEQGRCLEIFPGDLREGVRPDGSAVEAAKDPPANDEEHQDGTPKNR